VLELTGGDAELMDLLRESYDFLVGKEEQQYVQKMEQLMTQFAATLNEEGAKELVKRTGQYGMFKPKGPNTTKYQANPAPKMPKKPKAKPATGTAPDSEKALDELMSQEATRRSGAKNAG